MDLNGDQSLQEKLFGRNKFTSRNDDYYVVQKVSCIISTTDYLHYLAEFREITRFFFLPHHKVVCVHAR